MSDYRESHADATYGARYLRTYSQGYYSGLWGQVEKPLLEELLEKPEIRKGSALDFACGTGRISEVLCSHFGQVLGVDVSLSMLEQVPALPNLTTKNIDLTADTLHLQVDLVTAFRFFLNAQPKLRTAALTVIKSSLLRGGHLIVNVHMVDSSPMGRLYSFLRRLGFKSVHKTMSRREMRELLENEGFEVIGEYPYGFLPRLGRVSPRLSERLVGRYERIAKKIGAPPAAAHNLIFLAQKPF